MNSFSLKLEEFGFGKYSFPIPNNPPNYTTTLLLQDSTDVGVDVQFTAGIDIVKNELFFVHKWITVIFCWIKCFFDGSRRNPSQ